jgi:hypothetical protein
VIGSRVHFYQRRKILHMIGLVAVFVASSCDRPGEGPKAERGYARGARVVAALETYRQRHGSYPDSLGRLVPAFVEPEALATPTAPQEAYPWEYDRGIGSSFTLTFRYVGPGMNRCTYTGSSQRWACGGYY